MTLDQPTKNPRASRPWMPDYGIENEDNSLGLLPWSYVTERMERSRNYWVGTTRPDGRPHAMPVWGIWAGDAFYFSTGENSVKGRNLAANPAVVVHLESGDEVVILEGTAERVTDTDLLKRLDPIYYRKYEFHLWESTTTGSPIYRLRPSVAFAWTEKDFIRDATRWQFE